MDFASLTDEQQRVVLHPRGQHARVIAVAGSGKTTALAYRVQHLVVDHQIKPTRVRILMFNRLARQQFMDKLSAIGLPPHLQPKVNTFHSFAIQFLDHLTRLGHYPGYQEVWGNEKEELIRIQTRRAIRTLARERKIPRDDYDVDEAMAAVSLWKGALIPPERAGHHHDPAIALIYAGYELIRRRAQALTYDDFVPELVHTLETKPQLREEIGALSDVILVDEYQDVNFSQQRLVELLTGPQTEVMVVGDDDQTIYEWRGARPNYMLNDFTVRFSSMPCTDYTLSRSFRFGALIAQCADNVIRFNEKRLPKNLRAHHADQRSSIDLLMTEASAAIDSNRALLQQIVTLLQNGVEPRNLRVLGRMYSQFSELETQCLHRKIPYRVEGQSPFFKRREIRVLLDYAHLALSLDEPFTHETLQSLLRIANVPNRWLRRDVLSLALDTFSVIEQSLHDALDGLVNTEDSMFNESQCQNIEDLIDMLIRSREMILHQQTPTAKFFPWLINRIGYTQYFDDYYGKGETSEDRKRTVATFIEYAQSLALSVPDFLAHIETLDPSQGVADDEVVVMTTIFRVKGLEFDYVIIPNCDEGYLPCLIDEPTPAFDHTGQVSEPERSASIENERRLFYVALTRARLGVFIGCQPLPDEQKLANNESTPKPSRFIYEMELPETTRAMKFLQLVASHQRWSGMNLETTVPSLANHPRIAEGLVQYLNSNGQTDLASQLAKLLSGGEERPFSYPIPYKTTARPLAIPPQKSAKWWEDRDLKV